MGFDPNDLPGSVSREFRFGAEHGPLAVGITTAVNLAVLVLASVSGSRLRSRAGPIGRPIWYRPYLEAVPYDPFTGGSLQWKPLEKRFLIYAGSADRASGGGVVFSSHGSGKDVGFVLEPPQDRHQ